MEGASVVHAESTQRDMIIFKLLEFSVIARSCVLECGGALWDFGRIINFTGAAAVSCAGY